jgi:hypothetical protein
MNTLADNLPNTEQAQTEVVRQEPKPESDAALVDLGNVSDTRGGWFGPKLDVGSGFLPY